MSARILDVAAYIVGDLALIALAGYDLWRQHRAATAAPSVDREVDDLTAVMDSVRGTWRLYGSHRFPERAIKELEAAYDFDLAETVGVADRPERGNR